MIERVSYFKEKYLRTNILVLLFCPILLIDIMVTLINISYGYILFSILTNVVYVLVLIVCIRIVLNKETEFKTRRMLFIEKGEKCNGVLSDIIYEYSRGFAYVHYVIKYTTSKGYTFYFETDTISTSIPIKYSAKQVGKSCIVYRFDNQAILDAILL